MALMFQKFVLLFDPSPPRLIVGVTHITTFIPKRVSQNVLNISNEMLE